MKRVSTQQLGKLNELLQQHKFIEESLESHFLDDSTKKGRLWLKI